MSNLVAMPETIPSYLAALIAANPELALINQEALAGTSKPMPPSIVADKGKFVLKEEGREDEVIKLPNDKERYGLAANTAVSVLQTVVIRSKPGKEKTWYAASYSPGQEPKAPDCSSDDGIKPNVDSPLKQSESCASCAQNCFGSGKDQNGNPTKGKACKDKKVIAVFAAGKPHRFTIPPASLGNWDSYCRMLNARGLPLPSVMTVIGFEEKDDYKLSFTFGGMLAEKQTETIVGYLTCPEVMDIVSPREAQIALPAPPVVAPRPVIEEPKEKKPKAPPKPKPAPAPAPAPMNLGLGMDEDEVEEAVTSENVDDEAARIIAELGL